jgi:tetratricopeptide (TPR) repeat protein
MGIQIWVFLALLVFGCGGEREGEPDLEAGSQTALKRVAKGDVGGDKGPDTEFRMMRAREFSKSGEYKKALGELRLARDKDPENPLIYFELGRLCERLNQDEEAVSYFVKSIQLGREVRRSKPEDKLN